MLFEWNERKRLSNLRKHGLDFARAYKVFAGPTATTIDDRFDYGEQRFLTLGLLDARVVAIGHTEMNGMIRLITMRGATRYEQAFLFSILED